MKRVLQTTLLVVAMGMIAASMALAQVPRTISFQGVLADAGGVLLPDNTYTLTLSIYDQATGGTALFSESQQVQVYRGVFNAIIGSTSPTGIPAGLDFNAPYWLGVQVNNGTELSPRTAFTAVPYALNAAVAQVAVHAFTADTAAFATRAGVADRATLADTAIDVRGGFVASVNGQQGDLEILGAGSTTITRNGNQFIIRSTDTSGGGIRRIDNFDGSLVIDPPQGPFVTMFIREGGVQTYHLRDMSITTEKIADQAITNRKLAPNSVTTDKIVDLTILEEDLADNSVTTRKIRDLNVWTQDINDLAVTNPKIGPDAVTTDKIKDGEVTTPDIRDLAVTNPKLGPNSVTTDKIMDGEVTTPDIRDAAVTNPKLGPNSVTTDKIMDGEVTTPDIRDAAVTNPKLGPNSVTTDKIMDGEVTTPDIRDAAVTNPKLAPNAVTSDKIQDGQVWTQDLADGAVTNPKLGPNAVTTDKIMDGQVQTNDIADLNVTNGKLAANAVTTDKIMDGQVFSADIANGTILTEDIGNNQVSAAKMTTGGAALGTFLQSDGTATPIWSTNGQYITNINASNISHGTLADARLSSNVPLKNTVNVFTQLNSFNDGLTIARNGALAMDVWTDFTGVGSQQAQFRWTDLGMPEMSTKIGGKRYGAAFDWIAMNYGGTKLFGVRSEWTPALWYTAMDVNVDSAIFNRVVRFNGPVVWAGPLDIASRPNYIGDNTDNLQLTVRGPGAGATTDQLVVNGRANVAGRMTAASFWGDGANLTNLNATNIATGTLSDLRLSTNVPLKNAANTWTGVNTFQAVTNFNNTVNGTTFNGTSFNGAHTGDGSGLTDLNASNITFGTLADGRLSSNVPLKDSWNTFWGWNEYYNWTEFYGSAEFYSDIWLFGSTYDYGTTYKYGDAYFYGGLYGQSIWGIDIHGAFFGDGAGIVNMNASELISGTVPEGRLAGVYGNALNFPNPSNQFTGDGSGLTALNASAITSGFLNLNRIDASAASTGQAITFDGANVVWSTPIASQLAMPFAQAADVTPRMFALTNTNAAAGGVASFEASSATNSGDVLIAQTAGTGHAAVISNLNTGSGTPALLAQTMSTALGGSAAFFNGPLGATAPTVVAASWAANPAIYASSNGSGVALQGTASGTGNGVAAIGSSGVGLTATSNTNTAAAVTITNAANSSAALQVSTLGAGAAINASSTSGAAVAGTSSGGAGVNGTSTSGAGVAGTSTSGAGLSGYSVNGTGLTASSGAGTGMSATTGASAQYAGTFTGSVAGANGINITAGTGGTAIHVTNGSMVGSYTTVNNGGTIPADVMVVYVNSTAPGSDGSQPTVALPTGVNGQTIIVACDDLDGAVVGGISIWSGVAFRFTKLNGGWYREF